MYIFKIYYHSKVWEALKKDQMSVTFLTILILLFSKDSLNLSKGTVKTFIMLFMF